jgi:hypothetical protein
MITSAFCYNGSAILSWDPSLDVQTFPVQDEIFSAEIVCLVRNNFPQIFIDIPWLAGQTLFISLDAACILTIFLAEAPQIPS